MPQRPKPPRLDLVPEISYWSTEGLASRKKAEFWIDALCQAYFHLDCRPRQPDSFEGSIASISVAGFGLSRTVASEQHVANTQPSSCGDDQAFYLMTDAHNAWAITQDGRRSELKRGDLALVDGRRASLSEFPAGTNITALALPLPWVKDWLPAVEVRGCRVVSAERGWGRVLSTVCAELGNDFPLALQASPQFLSDHLGELLAASIDPHPPGARVAHELAERAHAAILDRLAEPALTAGAVAAQLGVSVRTLHRYFAAQDATFACTLRRIRLQRAVQLLANPRLARVSVAEIAGRCGFQTSSHFIREFQRHWGTTPGRWRLETTGKSRQGES